MRWLDLLKITKLQLSYSIFRFQRFHMELTFIITKYGNQYFRVNHTLEIIVSPLITCPDCTTGYQSMDTDGVSFDKIYVVMTSWLELLKFQPRAADLYHQIRHVL